MFVVFKSCVWQIETCIKQKFIDGIIQRVRAKKFFINSCFYKYFMTYRRLRTAKIWKSQARYKSRFRKKLYWTMKSHFNVNIFLSSTYVFRMFLLCRFRITCINACNRKTFYVRPLHFIFFYAGINTNENVEKACMKCIMAPLLFMCLTIFPMHFCAVLRSSRSG